MHLVLYTAASLRTDLVGKDQLAPSSSKHLGLERSLCLSFRAQASNRARRAAATRHGAQVPCPVARPQHLLFPTQDRSNQADLPGFSVKWPLCLKSDGEESLARRGRQESLVGRIGSGDLCHAFRRREPQARGCPGSLDTSP